MIKNSRLLLFLFAASVFFNSCSSLSPRGFHTQIQNVPMLREEGQFQGHGAISTNHMEGLIAYSPIKHVGILASTYNGTMGDSYEWGFGGYHHFEKGPIVEAYGIIGKAQRSDYKTRQDDGFMSYTSGTLIKTTEKASFQYDKRCAQINVGWPVRNWTLAISGKFTRAYYSHYSFSSVEFKREYWDTPFRLQRYMAYGFENRQVDFLSIAPTIQYSYKGLFFQAQLQFNYLVGEYQPFDPENDFYSPALISTSIGFNFNLHNKFR